MHLLRRLRERVAFWRWYLLEYVPIAGADGAGDGSGDGGTGSGAAAGSDGGDGDGDGQAAGDSSGEGDGGDGGNASGSGAGDGDAEGDGEDDGTVPVKRDELERLRRSVKQAEERERKRKRAEAEAAGKHEEVVRQVEQERDERDARIAELEGQIAKAGHDSLVRQLAGKLRFHDAEDAILRVPTDVAERGEAAVEKYLRTLATEKPHLVNGGAPSSGAPMGGNGGGGAGGELTVADVERMSRDEIAERWDDVQAALRRGQ